LLILDRDLAGNIAVQIHSRRARRQQDPIGHILSVASQSGPDPTGLKLRVPREDVVTNADLERSTKAAPSSSSGLVPGFSP
jgi:hypothetical protein